MKFLAILAASLLAASVAHADPIIVPTPKAPVSEQDAKAYVVKLELAVKKVCHDAAQPVFGVSYELYLDCIKATRAQVAKDDPTGLYAARKAPVVLAAN